MAFAARARENHPARGMAEGRALGEVDGDRRARETLMLLASGSYTYPALGVFWTILEIFLWVIWIWILIAVFIDIFRSHDLSGWAKALWFLFVLIIPLIDVLAYLILRRASMHQRAAQQTRRPDVE